MLKGTYQHSLDPKGRVNFPAKLREGLGGGFIITQGLDHCLWAYSEEEWRVLEDRIRSLPMSKARKLQQFFFAGAVDAEPDKQGRVLIPAHLRDYASLTKDIVIIGSLNHAEIWDKQSWQRHSENLAAEVELQADEIGF